MALDTKKIKKISAILIAKEKLNKTVYSFKIKNDYIANSYIPGQFINILIEGYPLRRPFSVCEITDDGLVHIIFKVKGEGTKKMSSWQKGKVIDILGPLGKGFSEIKLTDRILLVGGNLGLAPLVGLAKRCSKNFLITLAGFRTKEDIILTKNLKKYGDLIICTQNGSYEKKGLVTDYLEPTIKHNNINKIAACGPKGLLEKTSSIANLLNVFCEVSLEERMACGVGACLCCQNLIEKNGIKKSIHICKDGPVINTSGVKFI